MKKFSRSATSSSARSPSHPSLRCDQISWWRRSPCSPNRPLPLLRHRGPVPPATLAGPRPFLVAAHRAQAVLPTPAGATVAAAAVAATASIATATAITAAAVAIVVASRAPPRAPTALLAALAPPVAGVPRTGSLGRALSRCGHIPARQRPSLDHVLARRRRRARRPTTLRHSSSSTLQPRSTVLRPDSRLGLPSAVPTTGIKPVSPTPSAP